MAPTISTSTSRPTRCTSRFSPACSIPGPGNLLGPWIARKELLHRLVRRAPFEEHTANRFRDRQLDPECARVIARRPCGVDTLGDMAELREHRIERLALRDPHA